MVLHLYGFTYDLEKLPYAEIFNKFNKVYVLENDEPEYDSQEE